MPAVAEPVPYKDYVIIGDKAYRQSDGSVVWNKGNGMKVEQYCPTIVIDDKAVIALNGGKVLCVSALTGDDIWSFKSKLDKYYTEIEGFLAGQKMIFVNSEHVTALDLNGKILWQSKDSFPGRMAFLTNHLIVAGTKGTFCLSPKTGKVTWKNDLKGDSPAICGTKVYVPIDSGAIYYDYHQVEILSLIDGKEIGKFDIPKILKHPETIIGANRVYIGRPWLGETYCIGDKNPAP